MHTIDRTSDDDDDDKSVLILLLCKPTFPWTVDELNRELGDSADAQDAVGRLVGSGLLHRCGDIVFPTRSARRAHELQMGTV